MILVLLSLLACDGGFTDPSRALDPVVASDTLHPVVVHVPRTLGVADTELEDVHGTPIGVACVTCHGPDPTNAWAATPGEPFHTKIDLQHGNLRCNSCHESTDRTKLRLADGHLLELQQAMNLCAQCHSRQREAYEHGAHGGMNGYWDRTRGPRSRNHCIDCHAPHAPAYQGASPVHFPRDRYLEAH